ncbi:MAG: TonB-dependent receptor domain-containing protein, partial [Pseudomonadales bacterium]
DYIEDSDASPVNFFNFYLTTDAEQLSQEFRINGSTNRMNWVAGFYYLDLDIADSNGAESEPFLDPVSDTPFVTGLDNPYEMTTKSMSVFGQVEYDFSERLTGILGVRVINDDKDYEFVTNVVDYIPGTKLRGGNPNILATLASYEGDRDDTEWSIRLAANFQATDDLLVYASYNRGVKGGGFNAPIFPLNPPLDYNDDTLSYAPEQLDAFEVGFKARLADGLIFFNGAAYYYDYQDYQAFQIIGVDTITTNTDADSNGVELELQAAPMEGLDLIFGVAYNDTDVDLNGFGTTSVQSPNLNLNALIRYEFPMANGRLAFQYDAQYRSEHYFALTRAETVTENGYTVQNASLSYIADSGRWDVRAFINNFSDEEYLVQTFDLSGLDVFGLTEQYYGRPKWAGVSFAVHF